MSDVQDHYDYVLVGAGMAAASARHGHPCRRRRRHRRDVRCRGRPAALPARPVQDAVAQGRRHPRGLDAGRGGGDVDLRTRRRGRRDQPRRAHGRRSADGTTVRLRPAAAGHRRAAAHRRPPGRAPGRLLPHRRGLPHAARPRPARRPRRRGRRRLHRLRDRRRARRRTTSASPSCSTGALVQEAMFPEGLARHVTDAFTAHGVEIVHGLLAGGEARTTGSRLRLEDGTELSGRRRRHRGRRHPAHRPRRGRPASRSTTASWWTSGCAPAPRTCTPRATWRRTPTSGWAGVASSTPTTPRRWARPPAGSWPATDAAYDRTPFFWSDLYDDGYEAIGELSTRHTVVEDWKDDGHGAGVVYYLDGGAVRGVLLWNVWDSVPRARELIESIRRRADQPTRGSLRGRIPLG